MSTNRSDRIGAAVVAVLGLAAWAGALFAWATAQDRTTEVPADNYVAAIMLTVVGAALLIVAAVYDAARKG